MKELKKIFVWHHDKAYKGTGRLLIASDKNTSCIIIHEENYKQYLKGDMRVKVFHYPNWSPIKDEMIGKWCKFWDTEEEPNIYSSKIGRLKIIDKKLTYPYITTYGVIYRHCKQLKGVLEEVEE